MHVVVHPDLENMSFDAHIQAKLLHFLFSQLLRDYNTGYEEKATAMRTCRTIASCNEASV